MKIVNTFNIKETTLKDLRVGDTFLLTYNARENDKVFLRINNIINDNGDCINAVNLRDNCGVILKEDMGVQKIECVINVIH